MRDQVLERPHAAAFARLPTRAEFAHRMHEWRTGRGGGRRAVWTRVLLGLALGLGPLLTAMPLLELGARLGWNLEALPWWALLLPVWACMLAGLRVLRGAGLADARRHGLVCPTCTRPLVDVVVPAGGVARHELVTATGRCPECGAAVLRGDT